MAAIEAIATTYLEADAASVTFSSIPSTYEHLQLRFTVRAATASAGTLAMQFNSDTGSNYTRHQMRGYGSSTGTNSNASWSYINMAYITWQDGSSASTSGHVLDLLDYANTNKYTTALALDGAPEMEHVALMSGLWMSTAAVSTIYLYAITGPSFGRGSEFTLYGLNSS